MNFLKRGGGVCEMSQSDLKKEEECVCCFLATNPYACRRCWPSGGSKEEIAIFQDIVDAEILKQENKELL